MQYTYKEDAGQESITLDGELHKYLFKVRRHSSEENIYFRNLKDDFIYEYKVVNIDRRKSIFSLVSKFEKKVLSKRPLHIGWCVIDPKSIEKQIASLNELGLEKITFIYGKYSQSKYKPNIEKLEKMLINSSQQSGRSNIIKLEFCESVDKFLELYPDSFMFNFSKNSIDTNKDDIKTIIVGPEGGFSTDEIEMFSENKVVGIDSDIILRSETAVVTVASKIIV